MRYLLLLIVLLFSCEREPTRTRVNAIYPEKKTLTKIRTKKLPEVHEAYWDKLNSLLMSDRSDEVMRLIDSSIAKEPKIPGNYFFKGLVYDIRHDNRNALISYKKDIALYNKFIQKLESEDPDYKTAIFNRAIDQIYSGNKEGNKTLEAMLANEKDQDLKETIDLFVNLSRKDLINMDKLCDWKVFMCPLFQVKL